MKKRIFIVSLFCLLVLAISIAAIGCGSMLTVTVEGGSGGGEFEPGAECTVTADVPDGKVFGGWLIGDEVVSTKNPYTFEVTESVTIKASFLSVFAISVDGGKTSRATVTEGGTVTITADDVVGKKFVKWTSGGTDLSTENPYTFTPTASMNIVAVFADKQSYTITVTDGIGSGTYFDDDTCTVVANAVGKTFVNWTIDGTAVSTDICYSFKVSKAVTIKANYTTKTQLATTTAAVFSPETPKDDAIAIAMDRMYRVGSTNGGTMFTEDKYTGGTSIDFVLIYAYESTAAGAPVVGYFKYYMNTVYSLDDKVEFTQPQEWSTAGNYYIFGGEFASFLSEAWGDGYSNTTKYYFKNQPIAKVGSEYSNADISPVSTNYFSEIIGDYYLVTLVNCTAPGGRYPSGQDHSVGVSVGDSVTITATVPEGSTFVKWQKDGVDIAGATDPVYTFTPTAACTITAVINTPTAT